MEHLVIDLFSDTFCFSFEVLGLIDQIRVLICSQSLGYVVIKLTVDYLFTFHHFHVTWLVLSDHTLSIVGFVLEN